MKEAVTRRDMPIPVLIDCLPGTGVPLELGGRGRAPQIGTSTVGRMEAARTPTVAKARLTRHSASFRR